MKRSVRQSWCAGALALTALLALLHRAPLAGQSSPPSPPQGAVVYILPIWLDYQGAGDATFAAEVQDLRNRLGPEGTYARVGFTVYIMIEMSDWNVDITNPSAVRAALASTISRVDQAIAKARAHGIPICLSFLTYTRRSYDSSQTASEIEDVRNMQWNWTNEVARGWWSYSRYARKQRAIREAYIREVGRIVANRMALYPETLVAASGDGEVELSFDHSFIGNPSRYTLENSTLADYSPFTVEEFGDWLRRGGLYATGRPLAGQGYANASRYAGDASPALDTNGDGHTLNGDFATTFTSWSLRYFDWDLADATTSDPNAVPLSSYSSAGWNRFPDGGADRFDAPRVRLPGNPWWEVWNTFRQTMIWRYNLEFAEWITTSSDPATGARVPAKRWYSDQLAADYLFGHTPDNPDFRLHTSASPWWTADVWPYGSLGITSFNGTANGYIFHTARNVAPSIANRLASRTDAHWGILEWNPSVPLSDSMTVYRDEMAMIKSYRPTLLVPVYWGGARVERIKDTGFEVALRELIAQIKDTGYPVPLTLDQTALHFGATADGAFVSARQTVRVTNPSGTTTPGWHITSASGFLEVTPAAGIGSFAVTLRSQTLSVGDLNGAIVITPATRGYTEVSLPVAVHVKPAGGSSAPFGSFDTPADGVMAVGEVPVTGWVLDDIGVEKVQIYRSPVTGSEADLVYIGDAVFVEGARPDVAAAFATSPANRRAGWGYMLLTNMLPNQGNGTFTLHAYARDREGRSALLGSRRIVATNTTSAIPFGTIDTPAQGETVSGTIVNFGWALTPLPASIPPNGLTIDVVIDDVAVGHPVYDNYRSDIATLFPGYANSNGAIGYYVIDTQPLTNGVHTISWVVRDDIGRAAGVGSRFFTVFNAAPGS